MHWEAKPFRFHMHFRAATSSVSEYVTLKVGVCSTVPTVDPELLGGASSMTVARLIYNQFLGATQNWVFGSAVSMVLIMVVSIAIALLIKFGDATPQRF